MGLLDAPLRDVAKTLMDTFGTSVTVTIVSQGGYDAEAGVQPDESTTATALKGYLGTYNIKQVDGKSIKMGDRPLYVAAKDLATAPEPDDRVIVGSDTYRVVSPAQIQATDEVALYVLQLRKG